MDEVGNGKEVENDETLTPDEEKVEEEKEEIPVEETKTEELKEEKTEVKASKSKTKPAKETKEEKDSSNKKETKKEDSKEKEASSEEKDSRQTKSRQPQPIAFKPRKEEKEFEERIVKINRISKTVKGGKRMRFSAFVVIGTCWN